MVIAEFSSHSSQPEPPARAPGVRRNRLIDLAHTVFSDDLLQVLAALAFSRSPDSIAFVNPRRWSVSNLFVHRSIWDVPLIKPRFGCAYDMSLNLLGYELGERTANELESFKLGLKCERGYREVHPYELNVTSHQEFGLRGGDDGGVQDTMPDLGDFNVSVMYRTFSRNAELFNVSIQTVIKHFPNALEVVVVVVEEDEVLFQDIIDVYRSSASFPLRLVTEPDLMTGRVQQKYSKVRFKGVGSRN